MSNTPTPTPQELPASAADEPAVAAKLAALTKNTSRAGQASPEHPSSVRAVDSGDSNAPDTTSSNAGDTHAGDTHAGDTHAGDTHAGDTHAGDTHAGDTHAGDTHAGDTRAGGAQAEDSDIREAHQPVDLGGWEPPLLVGWVAIAVGAVYLGRWLWDIWDSQADYNHGFLIPPLAAWFAYENWPTFLSTPRRPSWWGLPMVLVGALLFVGFGWIALQLGVRPMPLYGMGLGILASAMGLLLLGHGWSRLWVWAFPLLLLLAALPIPGSIREPLQLQLKQLATWLSAGVLSVLVTDLRHEGNLLRLPSGDLGVEDACSGIRSLTALATFALLAAYLRGGGLWIGSVLLLISVPVAVLANLTRIVVTGLLQEYLGKQYTQDIPGELPYHTLLGLMVFVLGIGMLLAAAQWLPDFKEAFGLSEPTDPDPNGGVDAVVRTDPVGDAEVDSLSESATLSATASESEPAAPARPPALSPPMSASAATRQHAAAATRLEPVVLETTTLPGPAASLQWASWAAAVVLLLAALAGWQLDSAGPEVVRKADLSKLPEQIAGWQLDEHRDASCLEREGPITPRLLAAALSSADDFQQLRQSLRMMAHDERSLHNTREILAYNELTHRTYRDRTGRHIDMWVIFWSSDRCSSAGPHSPDVCMPLNSFVLRERGTAAVALPPRQEPLTVQKRVYGPPPSAPGGRERLMMFWYQNGLMVNKDYNWNAHPDVSIGYRQFFELALSGRWQPVKCTAQMFVMVSIDRSGTADTASETALRQFIGALIAEIGQRFPWAAPTVGN